MLATQLSHAHLPCPQVPHAAGAGGAPKRAAHNRQRRSSSDGQDADESMQEGGEVAGEGGEQDVQVEGGADAMDTDQAADKGGEGRGHARGGSSAAPFEAYMPNQLQSVGSCPPPLYGKHLQWQACSG